MKLTVVLLLLALATSTCEAGSVRDWFRDLGTKLRDMFSNTGKDLKEVASAVKDLAKDRAKSFLGQSLQATVGAVLESVKGFDLGEILFGKRELEVIDLTEYFIKLLASVEEAVDEVAERVYIEVVHVVDELAYMNYETVLEELHQDLVKRGLSSMEARGIITNTVKGIWNFLKDLKNVAVAVKDLTVDRLKSLGGQSVQALAGAVIDGAKGFNPGKIIGKREITEELLHDLFAKMESAAELLLENFDHWRMIIANKLSEKITQETGADEMVTRGVLGDTLNLFIDYLRARYRSVKSLIFGANPKQVAGPSSLFG